jgi:hypothetical protein
MCFAGFDIQSFDIGHKILSPCSIEMGATFIQQAFKDISNNVFILHSALSLLID